MLIGDDVSFDFGQPSQGKAFLFIIISTQIKTVL